MTTRDGMVFPPELAEKYFNEGLWKHEVLDDWLARAVEADAQAPAIDHPGGVITYGELESRVAATAGGFAALGIGAGDIVAMQLPNTPEFLIGFLAVGRLGGVLQTIHMPYGPKDIEFHLGHSRAKAVITLAQAGERALGDIMMEMKAKLGDLDHVITVGEGPDGSVDFSSLGQGVDPVTESAAMPTDLCMLLYTSGTTSNPKGVPLTFQNMMCNTGFAGGEFDITPDDRILSAAPYTHLYGIFSFMAGLSRRATAVLLPVFTPPDLAATMAAKKPTALYLAPAHAAALLGMGLMTAEAFSTLRLSVFSGSACPVDLMKRYQRVIPHSTLAQLWGMTELTSGSFTRRGDSVEKAATTAGPATFGNEVRVLSDEGAPLPAGEEGDLQIRGASVFAGYLDNADANAEAFDAEGWFRTGDLAVIDDDGYIRLTGRSKDIINRGGVKYNPADIEALLLRHDKIEQAAIVPMADEVLGERACCFVTLVGDAGLTLDEICEFLEAEKVTKYKWPERLEIVDEMPLTPTRKIIKGRLAAKLAT